MFWEDFMALLLEDMVKAVFIISPLVCSLYIIPMLLVKVNYSPLFGNQSCRAVPVGFIPIGGSLAIELSFSKPSVQLCWQL